LFKIKTLKNYENLQPSTFNLQPKELLKLRFYFLIILVLTLFFSCKNESDNISLTKPLKHYTNEELIFGSSYDCADDAALDCDEPMCNLGNPDCTRIVLDPCDTIYENMGMYAHAVACELNKQINNCGIQEATYPCTVIDTCIKDIFSSYPSLQNLINGGNPFRYCSSATSCIDHICPGSQYLHLYMSIEYQDSLISYAKRIAQVFKPVCPQEGYTSRIGNIYFKSCKVNESVNCYSTSTGVCFDTELRLHVEYFCCPQGGGGIN